MIDLVVSIINHKNRDLLRELLRSIELHTHRISYEVFVVDNASRDGSVEMVRSLYPWVHVLSNDHPMGFASNNNRVLHLAQSRYLILLNDDMLLLNDALDRMVAFMDANPSAGAVGCRLLNTDGTLQRSCWRQYPSPKTLFIDLFYLSRWSPGLCWVRDFDVSIQSTGEPVEVDYLLGACLMVRQQVIDQIGPLDENFFMFLEETDWCYRIRQRGWRVFWVPDGEITHYGQQSVSKDPVRFVPMLYRNYCRFCRKHGGSKREIVTMKAVMALGLSFRAAFWAIRRLKNVPGSSAMFRGYVAAVRALPSY